MIDRPLIFILFLVCVFACGEDAPKETCAEDPLEDLTWLKAKKEQLAGDDFAYITQAVFEGETVFIFGYCCETCRYEIPVRDCDGETIGTVGSEIAVDQLHDQQIIWQAEGSSCHFPT